jgi:hypothetical protein
MVDLRRSRASRNESLLVPTGALTGEGRAVSSDSDSDSEEEEEEEAGTSFLRLEGGCLRDLVGFSFFDFDFDFDFDLASESDEEEEEEDSDEDTLRARFLDARVGLADLVDLVGLAGTRFLGGGIRGPSSPSLELPEELELLSASLWERAGDAERSDASLSEEDMTVGTGVRARV